MVGPRFKAFFFFLCFFSALRRGWVRRHLARGLVQNRRVVRGQSPSPLTGMFFFFLRIFLRPGIMSEGCKPEFWIGRSGGAAKNVRHSVRHSVCRSVCLSQAPWPRSPVPRLQSPSSPFLFPPELNWWAGITCRVYGLLY